MTELEKYKTYLLQCVDCNCNNCHFFVRDTEKTKRLNNNDKIVANKIHYGFCEKIQKDVGEIANICLLHTQKCFLHRDEEKWVNYQIKND